MSNKVLRNTSWLTISAIAQKVISFVYFTVIARLVGVEHTGSYFFAISFTTIFTVVADFGLANVLTREGAKQPAELDRYLRNILSIKLVLGLVAYSGVALASFYLGYSVDLRVLILISGLTMFFDNIQSAFYSALRARQVLFYEALGNIMAQFTTLLIGSTALFLDAKLYWLILAYTIPSFLICIYSASVLRVKFGVKIGLAFDRALLKKIILIAVPFAVASIVGRLYSYTDLVMMSKMLSATEVGWWSVPYKIVFAFQFVPTALSASLYPAMSALYVNDRAKVKKLFKQSLKYLWYLSVPLAALLITFAEPIIKHLYGSNYLPSAQILRLLAISLIFTYTSLLNGALLNATNRQTVQTVLISLALVVNVACNLVMIPLYGITGAASSAVIASGFLMVTGWWQARRVLVND